MMRKGFTLLPFVSVVMFPWPVTAISALGIAVFEPLVPLAVGIFADVLYAPHGTWFPTYTLVGLIVAAIAAFVRERLRSEP